MEKLSLTNNLIDISQQEKRISQAIVPNANAITGLANKIETITRAKKKTKKK